MNIDNIEVNTQSSIKITLDKVLYFDPFKIENSVNDADIIFITHEHYDHFDIESINKVKNDNTIIVAPKSMEESIKEIEFKEYVLLSPDDSSEIYDIKIKAVRAYNNDKPFHPKSNDWLGYVVEFNNTSYYIAGDTDKTEDNEIVKCDVALVPIGGHFTMDVMEASELLRMINPKIVIPTHYGSIVGTTNDGKKLKDILSDTEIEVIEKL